MFRWDPISPVNLYLDASNFAAGCYITQTQDEKTKPLVYDSFIFLQTKQNYNTYKCGLAAIIKFTKKYSHILNAERQFIIYTDHKPLIRFLNADYHKDISAH